MMWFKFWVTFILCVVSVPSVFAGDTASKAINVTCDKSLDLTLDQHTAFVSLNARLSHLQDEYGKDTFDSRLQALLREEDAEENVVEVSPIFLEKLLYVVDKYRLYNAIYRTIGFDQSDWDVFQREYNSVLFGDSVVFKKNGIFDNKVEKLMKAIKASLNNNYAPLAKYPKDLRQMYIDEAIARVADAYITTLRMDSVNSQVIDGRAEAAGRQVAIAALGLVSGGVLVATTVYAGPIVTAAGAAAGGLSTNVITAGILARLGQVAAGVGMGMVGAPSAVLLSDSTNALTGATRDSENQQTKLSCELSKQFTQMRARGVKPYLSAIIQGGSVGMFGAVTLAGIRSSQALLWVTGVGVGVAEAYSLIGLGSNYHDLLTEYSLAMQAMKVKDKEKAMEHLKKSREYAVLAGEKAIESIIGGVLAVHVAAEFFPALQHGAAAIRSIFASSADTLPSSMNVVLDATGYKKKR